MTAEFAVGSLSHFFGDQHILLPQINLHGEGLTVAVRTHYWMYLPIVRASKSVILKVISAASKESEE